MLIFPTPATGELAHSYWGRLRSCNLFPTPDRAMRALVRHFEVGKHVSQQAFALAAAAGLTNAQFFRSHTLMPYVLAPSHQSLDDCVGYKKGGRRGSFAPALGLLRESAYFCPECAQGQRQSLGHAYWLCEHQLPGILWCPKHEIRLQSIDSGLLYEPPPDARGLSSLASEITSSEELRTLRRFAEVSAGLLERKVGESSVMAVCVFVATRGERLLSDEVAKLFPSKWISEVLPCMQAKVLGEPVDELDGKAVFRNPLALALSLTVFYETAQGALNAWFR